MTCDEKPESVFAPYIDPCDIYLPMEVTGELMRCAASNGRISYEYLLAIYRKGKADAALRAPAVTGDAARHAATLRKLAAQHEATAQRMGFRNSEHAAACRAGAEALAAPPAAGAPLDEMRRRWARCAEQSDRYLAQLEAHGIVPDDNCRQTPPKPAAGAPPALVAKLNKWLAQGYTDNETPLDGYGAEVIREVIAAWSPAPAPVAPPVATCRTFLSGETLAALDHGIRDLVNGLNVAGFKTTDSGDGCSKAAAIAAGEALPFRHVACVVSRDALFSEADRLLSVLGAGWTVEASYHPPEGQCLLFASEVEQVSQ